MTDRVLSLSELNRATLARQRLLRRVKLSPLQAIERFAGLQAQDPNSPYIGLWSRTEEFRRDSLARALTRKTVVRATVMRSTLHLMSAQDYLLVRNALQPALLRAFRSFFKEEAGRLDLEQLVTAAQAYLEEQPRTFPQLRAFLGALVPNERPASLSFAVRAHLPLVETPPSGMWRFSGSPHYTLAPSWLGQPLASAEEGLHHLVTRYLAVFGPATRKDVETWSGLTGLRNVIAALSPHLRTLRDEQGRELFDLPHAPLPRHDVPAPPRFLPAYDNLVLSHADRARVLPEAYRSLVIRPPSRVLPTFLVDGFIAGTWLVERTSQKAVLVMEPFEPLPRAALPALQQEAERLVRCIEDDAATFATQIGR